MGKGFLNLGLYYHFPPEAMVLVLSFLPAKSVSFKVLLKYQTSGSIYCGPPGERCLLAPLCGGGFPAHLCFGMVFCISPSFYKGTVLLILSLSALYGE